MLLRRTAVPRQGTCVAGSFCRAGRKEQRRPVQSPRQHQVFHKRRIATITGGGLSCHRHTRQLAIRCVRYRPSYQAVLLNEEKVMDLRSHFYARFSRTYDPWNFSTSWYEQRKIILTLAALPRNTYRNAFELGCANGVLTAELAHRAVALLSWHSCQQ